MPANRTRRYGRRLRRRPYRRRFRRRRRPYTARISRRGPGMPNSLMMKLKYADIIETSTPVAGTGTYAFRGNSIFDPDYTGVGHQPMYHDQIGALYSRYCVYGSKIRIKVLTNTPGDYPGIVTLQAVKDGDNWPAAAGIEDQLERRNVRNVVLEAAQRSPVAKTLSMYRSTAQVCGMPKSQVNTSFYQALVGANPSRTWYWLVSWQQLDTNPASDFKITFMVQILYYVKFYTLESVSTS